MMDSWRVPEILAYARIDEVRIRRIPETSRLVELLDNGFDLPSLEDFPYRNMITRALGAQATPDLSTHELRDGDLFLLCSDGLSGPVPEARMIEILGSFLGWPRCELTNEHASEQALWRAGWALVHEALERGGTDNVTVVLVRCSGQS